MATIDLISKDEILRLGDADVEILIRRVPPDTYREIRRRHTTEVRDTERVGAIPREVTDEDEVDRDVIDYAVVDWPRGVLLGGERAPCTRANKLLLPGRIRAQIIAAAFAAVNVLGDEELTLKNLLASSAPPPSAGDVPTSGV